MLFITMLHQHYQAVLSFLRQCRVTTAGRPQVLALDKGQIHSFPLVVMWVASGRGGFEKSSGLQSNFQEAISHDTWPSYTSLHKSAWFFLHSLDTLACRLQFVQQIPGGTELRCSSVWPLNLPDPLKLPSHPGRSSTHLPTNQYSPFRFSAVMWVKLKVVRNLFFSSKFGLLFISSGL